MATWPMSMPQVPLHASYSEDLSPRDVVLRTQMDTGAAKTRLRYTAGIELVSCSYDITTTQLVAFKNFLANDISYGADFFDFPHPRTGDTVTARIVTPIEPATPSGRTYWMLILSIELLP